MKEFSKFKVLGFTLLVTMSSCVVGSVDLNSETLRAYGFEFDITFAEKIYSVQKNKKTKLSSNSKFRFNKIIESGREHISYKGLSFDHSPVSLQIKFHHFQYPLINKIVVLSDYTHAQIFNGVSQLNRAGPC